MCHAHTVYGSAYASLGRPLAPITQDACAFFEDHAVLAQESGKVSVERGAGFTMAHAFKGVKAVIPPESRPLHGEPAQHRFGCLPVPLAGTLLPDAVDGRRLGARADRDPPGEGALQPGARRERVRRVALLPVRLRRPREDQPGHVPLEAGRQKTGPAPSKTARAVLITNEAHLSTSDAPGPPTSRERGASCPRGAREAPAAGWKPAIPGSRAPEMLTFRA